MTVATHRVRLSTVFPHHNGCPVLHAGSCAVVCAPTSSGKTFISSYVIQQVLRPEASAAAAAAAQAAAQCPAGSSITLHRADSKGAAMNSVRGSRGVEGGGVDAQAVTLAAVAAAASSGPTSEGVVLVLPTKALVNQLAAQVRPQLARPDMCPLNPRLVSETQVSFLGQVPHLCAVLPTMLNTQGHLAGCPPAVHNSASYKAG